MVNPQNCCARRAISQNNRTVISTAIQFSQGISPYRGRGKPKSVFVFILHILLAFQLQLSFIGSRSERSLPHWGGTQNSEVRVLHKKQQSFVSSAYSVYSEHLTATADDHMIQKWIIRLTWMKWRLYFAVTQWLCTWAHTDPQLDLQNVLDSWCDWTLFNSF